MRWLLAFACISVSSTLGICLIELFVRIEHGVPDGHQAAVIANVPCVVEVVVGGLCAERDESEHAPWEIVPRVPIVSVNNTDPGP